MKGQTEGLLRTLRWKQAPVNTAAYSTACYLYRFIKIHSFTLQNVKLSSPLDSGVGVGVFR